MTEHSKADEARKGLIDSVKGKAKEIVGAVTGNDSLTAEGQLEQTQAKERKEANSVEAVADAEAAQAHAEAAEARRGRRTTANRGERAERRAWRVPSEISKRLKSARPSRSDNRMLTARENAVPSWMPSAKVRAGQSPGTRRNRFRG